MKRAGSLGYYELLAGDATIIAPPNPQGLRTTVRQLGVPQTLLDNTALAASIEAEELARFTVPARRAQAAGPDRRRRP